MFRQLLSGLAAVGVVAAVSAKPITPEQALARIADSNPRLAAPLKAGAAPVLVHTTETPCGKPAVYIFDNTAHNGYLVLSADDSAYPVLGYADCGSADATALPPALKWWLEEYARQIEYASGRDSVASAVALKAPLRVVREAIEPMIKTKWDQVAPYNDQCPLQGTQRTYTGCVATAMAQVAKYWNYPEVGKGTISYECTDISKRLSLNFALKKFDWDNMLDTYLPHGYSDKEADAVAYLMKACGYSVKMSYNTTSSGALAMNIANGLTKYMGYDPNMIYDQRMYYSATEWDRIIYDNLKAVGPVIYGGGSMLGGGHSFIIDGYDGNGFYHFNWGWSGMSDGYFSLDALNPDALGTGGGTGGGYNFTQDAVLGIQPPTGKPAEERPFRMAQIGSLTAEVSDGILTFGLTGESQSMWVNYSPSTLKMKFGAVFEPQGNTPGETVRKEVSPIRFNVQPGYGTDPAHLNPSVTLSDLPLNDGTYKVTFASVLIETGGDDIWTPVRPGYSYTNYVVLRKSGDDYTVENAGVDFLELADATYLSDLYFGCLAKLKIEVVNESDIELSKGFAPVLISTEDGYPYFVGESVFVTLQPHTSLTEEWVTPLNLVQNLNITEDTEFYMAFLDESTGNFFVSQDKIVMHANPGLPRIALVDGVFIDGRTVTEELPDGSVADVTVVSDPNRITVNSRVRLIQGTFAYNCLAYIVDPFQAGEQVEILALAGMPMFMHRSGAQSDFSAVTGYPMLIPGKHYAVIMGFLYGSNYVALDDQPAYFRVDPNFASLDSLPVPAEGNGEIYNLQGMPLGHDLDALPAGIYIRDGKKILKN